MHVDGKNPRTSAASLYFCMAPSHDATKPPMQWNTGRIVCKGTVILHWLKGKKVIDVVDSEFIEFVGFEDELMRTSLFDQVIEKNVDSWMVNFEMLKLFRQENPDRWPLAKEKYNSFNSNCGKSWKVSCMGSTKVRLKK